MSLGLIVPHIVGICKWFLCLFSSRDLTNLLPIAILNIERALPVAGWPPIAGLRSNRQLWRLGRLLLFIIDLDYEADNADDN